MRKLKSFEKLMFILNSLMAFLLLLSYILPYVEPKRFPVVSVLGLAVPFLIIFNLLFVVYWLLKVQKQMFLSIVVLAIGYTYVFSLYKFSASKNVAHAENISIMNYNVRLFNVFEWIDDPDLKSKLSRFIAERNPDVLCLQEYRPDTEMKFEGYFKYEQVTGHKVKNGQAILTKFPIVNSGSIKFPNTSNNAIFVDVVKAKDTIRIYNVHLQSMGIDPTVEKLANEDSENLLRRVSKTFKLQQLQAEQFIIHKQKSPHPMIICGDFNNTAYSYVYKEVKGDMQDAFVEAGNGFGRTFDFRFFPVRIDFILVDPVFEINAYKTFDVKYSDHYPIMTKVKL
ncbi:endonuclease/exonuclease/phosphatase family protein [Subsaximicrobium wynnwilliamsii]|uniref:endonuclease/exonuclease/phosphatase family protein n=1 Tax=Subsaximicrobium wynnwilliamsii TaxID=291179 RepID=UPI00167AF0B2|nr:endonuclease/exonuclease/phosphatase family protein [Subsaximicrobium wynnwilliamsii]